MFKRIALYLPQHPHILFVAVSLWLCFEYVILGPYSYVRVGDNFDIFIPRLATLWDGFILSGAAHWSTLFAGGIDRLANDMVYPNVGGALFAVFPAWLAMGLLLFGTLFVAGWYTYRIAQEDLALSRGASILAGMFFSLALIQTDIIPYLLGLSIVPVALYYLPRVTVLAQPKRRYGYAVLLGLIFALFSSVPFTLPFTLSAIAVWFLIVQKNYMRRDLLVFVLFAMAAIVPHIPVVQSLIANASLSNRGGDFYRAGLAHAHAMIRYLAGLYWLPGALVVLGFLWLRIRERAFFGAVLLAGLFFTIGVWYQPFATRFGAHFRLVKDFGFDRFYLLIPFFLALGFAFTIDALPCVMATQKRSYAVRTIFLMVIAAVFFGMSVHLKVAHARTWFRDGSFYANRHSPDLASVQSPDEPFRVATIADERTGLRPAFANMNGFETIDGDINIASKRYVDFFKEMGRHWRVDPKHSFYFFWQATPEERERLGRNANEFLNPALLSLANVRYVILPFPMTLPGFRLVSEALPEDGIAQSIRARIAENFHGRRVWVYENQDAFPRVFLTQTVRVFSDAATLLEALGTASTGTLKSAVFAEVKDMNPLSVLGATIQEATITSHASDEIVVSTRLDAPSVLVLTNNYNPGWHVYADGVEKKVIPAYHTFMAVILERETHEVVWRYEP